MFSDSSLNVVCVLADYGGDYVLLCDTVSDGINYEEHRDTNRIIKTNGNATETLWSGECLCATMNREGQILILSSADGFRLDILDDDGTLSKSVLIQSPPDEYGSFPLQGGLFAFTDCFAVVRIGGVQIFSYQGEIRFQQEYSSVYNCAAGDDRLYLTEYPAIFGDKNRLFALNVNTLLIEWSADVALVADQVKVLAFNQYDGALYYVLNNALQRWDEQAQRADIVCNLLEHQSGLLVAGTLQGNGVYFYSQLVFENESDFLLLLLSENHELFKFSKNGYAQNSDRATINVLLPLRDVFLETRAAQFEAENTGIKVAFEYYRETGNAMGEDFIRFLNLKILSGEQTWDIVPIVLLPYWQYIQKGVLLNIDSMESAGQLSDENTYYTNIFDGARIDGKLYYIPTFISFPSILVDTEDVRADGIIREADTRTWGSMVELLRSWDGVPFKNDPIFTPDIASDVYYAFISDFYSHDDIANFTERLGYISFFSDKSLYTENNAPLAVNSTTLWRNYSGMPRDYYNAHRFIPMPVLENDDRRVFNIQMAYAINAGTQYPDEALRFLLYIASDKASGYLGSIMKQERDYITDELFSSAQANAGSRDEIAAFVDSMLTVKSALNYAPYFDLQLGSVIGDIINSYLSGAITREQAARSVADRVWLYANE